jgi:hypothetical protein
MSKQKVQTVFDHLKNITERKTKWESFDEGSKKSFAPYLINRWLSQNPDLIQLVNTFQPYTIGNMSPKEVYKFYSDLLPKMKLPYTKYIKGKKESKYNDELVSLLSNHYRVSKSEAIDYLDIFYMDEDKKNHLIFIMERYGYEPKKIKQVLKINKK